MSNSNPREQEKMTDEQRVAGGESETRKIRQKSIGDWAIAAFGEAEALSLSQRGSEYIDDPERVFARVRENREAMMRSLVAAKVSRKTKEEQ